MNFLSYQCSQGRSTPCPCRQSKAFSICVKLWMNECKHVPVSTVGEQQEQVGSMGKIRQGVNHWKGVNVGGRAQGWYGSPLVAPCTAKVQAQGPSQESQQQPNVMGLETELETRLQSGSKVHSDGKAGIICLQHCCCGEWWLQTEVKLGSGTVGRDGGAGGGIKPLGALRAQAFVCKRNKTNSAPLTVWWLCLLGAH